MPEPEEKRALQEAVSRADVTLSHSKSLFVVSGILFIVAAIFLVLSWRYNAHEFAKVFTPTSIEFIFCCLCLLGGLAALTYGLVTFLLARKKKKGLLASLYEQEPKQD